MYALALYVTNKGWIAATSIQELKDKIENEQFVSNIQPKIDVIYYLTLRLETATDIVCLYIHKDAENIINSMTDLAKYVLEKFKDVVPEKFRDVVNFVNKTFSDFKLSYRLIFDNLMTRLDKEDFDNLWNIQLSMEIIDCVVCQNKRTIECTTKPSIDCSENRFEITGEINIDTKLEIFTKRITVKDIKKDAKVIIEAEDEY